MPIWALSQWTLVSEGPLFEGIARYFYHLLPYSTSLKGFHLEGDIDLARRSSINLLAHVLQIWNWISHLISRSHRVPCLDRSQPRYSRRLATGPANPPADWRSHISRQVVLGYQLEMKNGADQIREKYEMMLELFGFVELGWRRSSMCIRDSISHSVSISVFVHCTALFAVCLTLVRPMEKDQVDNHNTGMSDSHSLIVPGDEVDPRRLIVFERTFHQTTSVPCSTNNCQVIV